MTTVMYGPDKVVPGPTLPTIKPVLCEHCQRLLSPSLTVDNRMAFWKGTKIRLTNAEYRVLALLYTNTNRFVSYREIYDVVQSPGFHAGLNGHGYTGNVRTIIKRIRKRLVAAGGSPDMIENHAGFGYRWKGEGQ